MFFQEIISYIIGWIRSRRWRSVFAAVFLCMSLLTVATAVTIYGWSLAPHELSSNYLKWAEEDLVSLVGETRDATKSNAPDANDPLNNDPKADAAANAIESRNKAVDSLLGYTERVSPSAQLLFRRVLELERFNSRAKFLVALRIGQQGRMGTARQMMRSIAPLPSKDSTLALAGYAPAHAWLATEQLLSKSFERDKRSREILMMDLEVAAKWKGVSQALLTVNADALASSGQFRQAIDMLQSRISEFPELDGRIAELAKRAELAKQSGFDREFTEASQAATTRLKKAINAGDGSIKLYFDLARIESLSENFDQVIRVASLGREANKKEPAGDQRERTDQALRRMISGSYLEKYRQSRTQTKTGVSMNIEFLDQALKVDPTNPYAVDDVAQLVAMGAQASAEMRDALKSSLADGSATALTHLILANSFLVRENVDEAIPHLEQALLRAPDSPVVLNNYALVKAQQNRDDIPASLEMIEKALKIAGLNPSMLDTKGQILELKGDIPNAIICYEDAISLDNNKVNTRRHLANAYRQAGMVEMADQQLISIAKSERAAKQPVAPGDK